MTISHARIYALWTLKVRNKCAHICAMDPKELNSSTYKKDAYILLCQIFEVHNLVDLAFSKISRKQFSLIKDFTSINTVF